MCLAATAFWYFKYAAETVVRHGVHPLLRMPPRRDGKHTTSLPGD